MAKLNKNDKVIPFAEGAPADNLIVEELDNETVLIGEPEEYTEPSTEFDANLAEVIDQKEINEHATILLDYYETDRQARSTWEERYKEGLKTLDPDGGMMDSDDQRATRGLSQVVHPMIAEAATQFQSRAIAELFPAGGPVKTVSIGEADDDVQEQAIRVKDYMNYQLLEEMPEYFPDVDQMLFHLPLIGQTFKKVWYDPAMKRITSRFVKAENFVVAPESTDLLTSPRYTHVIEITRNEYNKFVQAGYYLPADKFSSDGDPNEDVTYEIEGIDPSASEGNDEVITLLEMHTSVIFKGIDGGDPDDVNSVALPYVITIDEQSQQIVSIRRNWQEDDEEKDKLNWFVEYKFLPGLGFYGFGLYHIIGGLGKAATGSLRALLDSAAFANMQGGFKLKGRVPGGELDVNPGEYVDLDAAVDDIGKAIMPLPFKEPSSTLFQLLGFIVDAGRRYAAVADLNVGDANPNAPVGTTIAMLEQGSKIFSAIHKRLHYAQGKEFKLIMHLNAVTLPEQVNFAVSGASQVIYAKDFDERIDVIPVSDPSIFSSTQRIAQAQAILQLAQSAPKLHDMYEAYKRMYEAIRVPDIDQVLKKPEEAPSLDPVDENVSALLGKPIKAFIDQNHEAHIAVHMQFLQDPSLAGNPIAQKTIGPMIIAHIGEHVAMLYRIRMQKATGVEFPKMPNIRDPKFQFESISPELNNMIAERAAQVVQQSPKMQSIGGLDKLGGAGANNPMNMAQQLAKIEAESVMARTKAEIQADQAKAKSDMQIDQAKAQADIQKDQVKTKMDIDKTIAKTQAELEAKLAKLNADIEIAKQKAVAEIQMKGMKDEL
tara:strand:- start:2806 stop:5283 length:2478 start_codon:yes stop_codon:yes gene_type:complete